MHACFGRVVGGSTRSSMHACMHACMHASCATIGKPQQNKTAVWKEIKEPSTAAVCGVPRSCLTLGSMVPVAKCIAGQSSSMQQTLCGAHDPCSPADARRLHVGSKWLWARGRRALMSSQNFCCMKISPTQIVEIA